ncbi:hypothetical protein H6P81_000105 [Aristolochia fimbriata]|uniref:Neprosin PEP catalytic domain-containing protein n=1 Tax=Aristolochia fimbriata TaxID=158543 RepID=A0AAV7F735_ARIFI|nr:hypothetical protein H6P81_000105 [Aristolochia fimbriata]
MKKKPTDLAGYRFGRAALVVVFLFLALSHIGEVEARRPWKNGGGSTRAHKFAVKTMKSADGDIIDCVDIYKQPAFDHPALKNHTIQREPDVYPSGFEPVAEKATASVRQLQRFEKCPQGTIPLLRNRLEVDYSAGHHVLARSGGRAAHMDVDAYGTSSTASESSPNAGHEYAVVSTASGGQYYGAKAVINLWNPSVEGEREFSLSQLWVLGGSYTTNDLNSVEAGWMVHPYLYGDSQTRLFIYWTNSAYQGPGCYNLKCAGFVQTSTEVAMGAAFNPSTYGGEQQELILTVFKDKSSGNWWLMVGESQVGYWPASLFNTLADSASMVQWGGEIVNDRTTGRHTATDMGSGHFPTEGSGKASYFKNIQVVDGSNALTSPPPGLGRVVTNAQCYDMEIEAGGSSFNYGGPGLSDECP